MLMVVTQACERTVTVVEDNVGEPQSCFECHDDQNTFLIAAEQQWQNSFHASGLNIDRGSSATCAACHISEGFVQRANGEAVTSEVNPTTIHCFTCHQPHTNADFELRWTATAELMDGTTFELGAGNLCVACHFARRDVNAYITDPEAITSTHWGPHHSVQGDMLIGSNGYEYEDFDYEITPHRSATNDGCIDCHFLATSNNIVGGHSFNMRGDARDEGGEFMDLLNTDACEPCHGDLDDFNYKGVQDEVDSLIVALEVLVEGAGLWENGHPKRGVTTSADSAGAVWNLLMAEEDRSRGVHNRKYFVALLESAIMFMEGNLPQPGSMAGSPPSGDLTKAER
jgi:hypothetical protein